MSNKAPSKVVRTASSSGGRGTKSVGKSNKKLPTKPPAKKNSRSSGNKQEEVKHPVKETASEVHKESELEFARKQTYLPQEDYSAVSLSEEVGEVVIQGPELEESSTSSDETSVVQGREEEEEGEGGLNEFEVWEKTHKDLAARAEEVVAKMLGGSRSSGKHTPFGAQSTLEHKEESDIAHQPSGLKGKRTVSFKDTISQNKKSTSPIGDGNIVPSSSPDRKVCIYCMCVYMHCRQSLVCVCVCVCVCIFCMCVCVLLRL